MTHDELTTATISCIAPTHTEELTYQEALARLQAAKSVYYSIPLTHTRTMQQGVAKALATPTLIANVFIAGGEIQRGNETYTLKENNEAG